MDPVEALGVGLSIAAVWLTTARNAWCWPVGLASVVVYAWIFAGARLYSDALLQIVYAALEVYGWWQWRRAPVAAGQPAVRRPSRAEWWVPAVLALVGAAALGAAMARFTDAALPWLDAVLTAASLVAQFWMARLIRANWLLWIAVDVVYVGVYVSRGLPLTGALYAGFVVLAVIGWRRWAGGRGEWGGGLDAADTLSPGPSPARGRGVEGDPGPSPARGRGVEGDPGPSPAGGRGVEGDPGSSPAGGRGEDGDPGSPPARGAGEVDALRARSSG